MRKIILFWFLFLIYNLTIAQIVFLQFNNVGINQRYNKQQNNSTNRNFYVEVEGNGAAVSNIKPTRLKIQNYNQDDSLKIKIYAGSLLKKNRVFTLLPKENEEYEITIRYHWMLGPVATLIKGEQAIDTLSIAKKYNINISKKANRGKSVDIGKVNINNSDISYKDESTMVKLSSSKLKAQKEIDSTKNVGVEVSKSGNVKVSGNVDNVGLEVTKNQVGVSYKSDSIEVKTNIGKEGVSLQSSKDSVSVGIEINNQVSIKTSDKQGQNQIAIDKENVLITSQNYNNNTESTLKYSDKEKSLSWEYYQKSVDDSIRTNWLKKGGTIFNKSTTFELLNITMLDSLKLKGWGIGFSDHTNLHRLKIKNLNKSSFLWGNFSYGFVNNYSFFYFAYKEDFLIMNDRYKTSMFILSGSLLFSGRLSYNVGITTNNSFISKLKGVLISISYEPSLMFVLSSVSFDMYCNDELFYSGGDADVSLNINPMSWRIDFDFVDFSSFMYRKISKAGLKISLKVYPSFADNKYVFTMFSIGWNTYIRPANKYLNNPL